MSKMITFWVVSLFLVRYERRSAAPNLVPDPDVVGRLADEDEADDDPNRGNRHRIEQPAQGDAGDCGDRGAGGGDQPAKDAVADMIGQRHRGVTDARRKQLD